ncbi:ABC-type glycerol-3-phosphate transport system, substrate-binding protein [Ruminococcus sp. YRD2003]|uniref:hypothetical protein n=1 Tax=Ruminococcus sp. YRD2003 TaxID=1452313 RepID=UPI0008C9E044|nr:ABC-type glycerol-3-phosphate transport system, substrate-binding protein [Ruminococcus flavefaciens]
MKKTAAVFLAAMTVLAGCGERGVSRSESSVTSDSSSAADTDKQGDDIVLTIGVVNGDPGNMNANGSVTKSYFWTPMQELVDRFNSEDNGIRIEIKNYAEMDEFKDFGYDDHGIFNGYSDDEMKTIDFQVAQDLINKKDIDIVGTNTFANSAKYEIFKRKGGFADLYEFMKDDPEVNSDTLNKHILELNERDGKLYSIPLCYTARTLIGESQYVGTKRNWSIDEFIDCWNRMPEGSTVTYSNEAEVVYYDVLRANTTAFIDYVSCKTRFDDPDFRKMLEFCKQFPSNMGIKKDGGINYTDPQLVKLTLLTGYGNAILEETDYSDHSRKYCRLRDGSHTLVGFPTSDGKGAFLCGAYGEWSIRSNISKEKQQAAWTFLRELYTEDFQTDSYAIRHESNNPQTGETFVNYVFMQGFPVNNAARKNIAQNLLGGKYDDATDIQTIQGIEVTEENKLALEQEDIDYIDEYIDSIDRWEFPDTDRELFWIIEDEVLAYFHGDQDVDTVVDHVQDRAGIWLSEQA